MGRRKAGPNRVAEDEMPSSDDPRWAEWGSEVESYLDGHPMSAKELLTVLPNYSLALVVNTLSWLSVRGRIVREGTKPVRWGVVPSSVEVPPPARCRRCGGPWTQSVTGIICQYCGRPRVSTRLSAVPDFVEGAEEDLQALPEEDTHGPDGCSVDTDDNQIDDEDFLEWKSVED